MSGHAFEAFNSWKEVLAAAHAGEPLYYHAPLDAHPVRVEVEARARSLRVFPPGSRGRGKARTSDPFTADKGHLSRFRRMVGGEGAPDYGSRSMSTYPRAIGGGSHRESYHGQEHREREELTREGRAEDRIEARIDKLEREVVDLRRALHGHAFGARNRR